MPLTLHEKKSQRVNANCAAKATFPFDIQLDKKRGLRRRGAGIYDVSGYSLPKLHVGKMWYVDFVCWDPLESRMRRKKYHLDGIKSLRERRLRAAELIAKLTERLRGGWNCWADVSTSRGYTTYEEVRHLWLTYIDKLFRTNAIRENTFLGYKSYFMNFDAWLRDRATVPVVYAFQLTGSIFSDFLDYMFLVRDVSAQTRNNYKAFLSVWCTWLVDKGFIGENPMARIKKLRVEPKHRDALLASALRQMREYLERYNRHFLLACLMEYFTFIRPIELAQIRVGDIRVKERKVVVSGEVSKNRRDGAAGLNDILLKLMLDLDVFAHPSEHYLFGGRDFMPSSRKMDSRAFREEFARMRKVLKWPESYQFYSLKDSGIRDLANARGIVVARDQARHTDVTTTNKYLKSEAFQVPEEAKHFLGVFGDGAREE